VRGRTRSGQDARPDPAPDRFGNNYGDSGGRTDQAIADTTVYLPTNDATGELPAGIRLAGMADVTVMKKARWSWTPEKKRFPSIS